MFVVHYQGPPGPEGPRAHLEVGLLKEKEVTQANWATWFGFGLKGDQGPPGPR